MTRPWRWALGILVSSAGLWYAVRFPWLDTWATLGSADWGWLAAAGAANLLSLVCKAFGWHLLLRPLAPVRARITQAATFAGAAVGSIGITMSGEAARLQLVTMRGGVEPATAARTIAASRVLEAAALGVFLVAFAAGAGGPHRWRLLVGAAALTAAALALARWLPWLRPRGPDGRRAAEWSAGRLIAAVLFGVTAWGLQWATYHWSIVATHAAVTPLDSLLALLLSNLGGAFRLTPGNVGIVQGAVVLGLAPAGVPAARAVAAGLVLQAVEVFPVLLIGLAILGRQAVRSSLASLGMTAASLARDSAAPPPSASV